MIGRRGAPNSRNFFVPSSGSLAVAGRWLAGAGGGKAGEVRGGRRFHCAVPGYILHRVTPVRVRPSVRPSVRRQGQTAMKGEQSVMNRIAVHVWTGADGVSERGLPTVLTLHNATPTLKINTKGASPSPPPPPPRRACCRNGMPEDFPLKGS